ncbi:permease [Kocuria sp.]|uniref:permease n=1 Tax=Kocuria sp. TaxID=1871328 RepID=UPI002647D1FF|nr:permease [Kocuria sp.]MDN5631704.1 permease [Kocuria sp.]
MSTTTTLSTAPQTPRHRALGWAGLALTLAILVAGLLWAKWIPYDLKARTLAETGVWDGKAVFGAAETVPSWQGAWAFTVVYAKAVWKAALVALLVAAALESLVPRRWLLRVLSRRTSWGQGISGALLALPSMMCTCCTAPVAIGLRRSGAPAGATMAYWLANPLLNPAVLMFLGLTMSWPFVTTRVAVGVLVVLIAAVLVSRRFSTVTVQTPEALPADPQSWGQMLGRFVKALGRYLVVLVPEYLLLVLLVGFFAGWLSDFAALSQHAGVFSLLLVGVVGAALVIPTGGEIPVVLALTAAGASCGVAGALLITLPALSVPSIVMVARDFGVRTTLLVTGWVVLGGLLAAGLLVALV